MLAVTLILQHVLGVAADDRRSVTSDGGTWNAQQAAMTSSRSSMETKVGVAEDNLMLVAWAFVPLAVSSKIETLHTRVMS